MEGRLGNAQPTGLPQNGQGILLFREDLFGLRKTIHGLIGDGRRLILEVDKSANYGSSH